MKVEGTDAVVWQHGRELRGNEGSESASRSPDAKKKASCRREYSQSTRNSGAEPTLDPPPAKGKLSRCTPPALSAHKVTDGLLRPCNLLVERRRARFPGGCRRGRVRKEMQELERVREAQERVRGADLGR